MRDSSSRPVDLTEPQNCFASLHHDRENWSRAQVFNFVLVFVHTAEFTLAIYLVSKDLQYWEAHFRMQVHSDGERRLRRLRSDHTSLATVEPVYICSRF